MDFALPSSVVMLQEATRKYAQRFLAPLAAQHDRTHTLDHSVIHSLAEQGLLGVNIPQALGGCEAGALAYAVALKEIAQADASVAVTMAVTNMVAEVITRFGTEAQKTRFVPGLTSGAYYGGAFALSEAGAGSDAGALTTQAQKCAEGWVLNGQKMWISTGDRAGVFVVWARTGGPGAKGISCFLVPAGTPGLEAGKPIEKMGLKGSHTVPLSLQDVHVPEGMLLGEEGQGFKIAMMALDGGRIGIGAQSVGIASAAFEHAKAHVVVREQFGKPLAQQQSVMFACADMAVQIETAWLLTLKAAWLKQEGQPFSVQAAMAKVHASESANAVVRMCVQLLGGYGYMEESVVARLYRDCRVTQIYEGTSEIQRLVIARHLLQEQGV
jgi:alkylation response protein AidB-like acyl-CoA dehydrogenase